MTLRPLESDFEPEEEHSPILDVCELGDLRSHGDGVRNLGYTILNDLQIPEKDLRSNRVQSQNP